MENITKKLVTTVIHVAEIKANEDGTHSLENKPDMRVEATRVEYKNAVKYVENMKPEGANYAVLGVDYEENNYTISVEDFIKYATKK